MANDAAPKLEFSKKYSADHSQQYYEKHQQGLWRKLSDWREQMLARKALSIAGDPHSVLDIPCGTGRFWEVLTEQAGRKLYAADFSSDMLQTGLAHRPQEIVQRFETFHANAFSIPVPDNFAECVFCIRFFHHIGQEIDRIALLQELSRVSSDTIILSLWTDKNIQAMRRKRLETHRSSRSYQNRFIVAEEKIEAEFDAAHLEIIGRLDFLKFYSMWRFYVLRKSTPA